MPDIAFELADDILSGRSVSRTPYRLAPGDPELQVDEDYFSGLREELVGEPVTRKRYRRGRGINPFLESLRRRELGDLYEEEERPQIVYDTSAIQRRRTRELLEERRQIEAGEDDPIGRAGLRALLGLERAQEVDIPRMIAGLMTAGGRALDQIQEAPLPVRAAVGAVAPAAALAPKGTGERLKQVGREAAVGTRIKGQEYTKLAEGVRGGFLGDVAEGVSASTLSMLPTIPAAIAGGVPASAVVAGLQSFGSTYADAADAYEQAGLSRDEAEAKATGPAAISGLVTALFTRGFGKTGLEKIVTQKVVPKGFGMVVKELAKDIGLEVAEEAGDQAWQAVIGELSFRPNMTAKDALKEITIAGLSAGLLSTSAGSVRTVFNRLGQLRKQQEDDYFDGSRTPAPGAPRTRIEPAGRVLPSVQPDVTFAGERPAPANLLPAVRNVRPRGGSLLRVEQPVAPAGSPEALAYEEAVATGAIERANALQERSPASLPVRQAPKDSPAVVEEVRTPEAPAQAQAAKPTTVAVLSRVIDYGLPGVAPAKYFDIYNADAEGKPAGRSLSTVSEREMNERYPGSPIVEKPKPAETPTPQPTDQEILAALEQDVQTVQTGKPKAEKPKKEFLNDEEKAKKDAVLARLKNRPIGRSKALPGFLVPIPINPEIIADVQELAGIYMKAGVRNFKEFAEQIITDVGDVAKPILRDIYVQLGGKLGRNDGALAERYQDEYLETLPDEQLGEFVANLPGDQLAALVRRNPDLAKEFGRTTRLQDVPSKEGLDDAQHQASVARFNATPGGTRRLSAIGALTERYKARRQEQAQIQQLEPGKAVTPEHVDFEGTFVATTGPKKNQATEPAYFEINQRDLRRNPDRVLARVVSGARSATQTDKPTLTRRLLIFQDNETGEVFASSVHRDPKATVKRVEGEAAAQVRPRMAEQVKVVDPRKVQGGKTSGQTRVSVFEIMDAKTGTGTPKYTLLGSARLNVLTDGLLQRYRNAEVFEREFRSPSTQAIESARAGAERVEGQLAAMQPGRQRQEAEDESTATAEAIEQAAGETSRTGADVLLAGQQRAEADETVEEEEQPTEEEEEPQPEAGQLEQVPAEETAEVENKNPLNQQHVTGLWEAFASHLNDIFAPNADSFLEFSDVLDDALDTRVVADAMKRMARQAIAEGVTDPTTAVQVAKEKLYDVLEGTYQQGQGAFEESALQEFGQASSTQAGTGQETQGPKPTPIGDRLEKAATFLERLKIQPGGRLLEGSLVGIPITVWNGSINIVQLALKAGSTMADAIAEGIRWIRENHPEAKFDDADYENYFYNEAEVGNEDIDAMQQAGQTSIAQLVQDAIQRFSEQAAQIVKGEKVTSTKRQERRTAQDVLSNPIVRRLFVKPLDTMSRAAAKMSGLIYNWADVMKSPAFTTAQKSAVTGQALKAIDEFVAEHATFNAEYKAKRAELLATLEKIMEARGEAKREVAAVDSLMDQMTDLLKQGEQIAKSASEADTYRRLLNRNDGARHVFKYILESNIPASDILKLGNKAALVAKLEEATGAKFGSPEMRQALGASDQVIDLVAEFFTASEEMRQFVVDAKEMLEKKGSEGIANDFKAAMVKAIKEGKSDEAMQMFVNGIGDTAVQREESRKAASTFAYGERRVATQIQALDAVKKLLDSVANNPEFKKLQKDVFAQLGVADIIRGINGTQYELDPVPGTETKTIISLDATGGLTEKSLADLKRYNAEAMAYVSDPDADGYNESRARALKEWLQQSSLWLRPEMNPKAGRLLPNWLVKLPGPLVRFLGAIPPMFVEKFGAGPAFNLFRRTDVALSTAREIAVSIFESFDHRLKQAAIDAFKSHDNMTASDYKNLIFNPLAASRQYFGNARQLKAGDPIGNGHKVTNEDITYLKTYRAYQKALVDKLQGTAEKNFAALKNFRSGIIEKDASGKTRIRQWFESGPDTVDRHWRKSMKWWEEWHQTDNKEAFINQHVNDLLWGYVQDAGQPSFRFNYFFEQEFKDVINQALHGEPIASFDDLAARVMDLYNGRVADAEDAKTLDQVKEIMLSEMDSLFKRVDTYKQNEAQMDSMKSYGSFFGGQSAANTARGAQVLPSLWYDYGAVTTGEHIGFMNTALAPLTIQHMQAARALLDSLRKAVDDLKGKKVSRDDSFLTRSEARSALAYVQSYVNKLESAMLAERGTVEDTDLGIDPAIGAFTSSVLSNPGPVIFNTFGGVLANMLTAREARNQGLYKAAPHQMGRAAAGLFKELLRVLAHEKNPVGRKLYSILKNPEVSRLSFGLSKLVGELVDDSRRLHESAREDGIAHNKNFARNFATMRQLRSTGGVIRDPSDSAAGRLGREIEARARAFSKTVMTPTLGFVDEFVNIQASQIIADLETDLQKRAIKAMEERAKSGDPDAPITDEELVGGRLVDTKGGALRMREVLSSGEVDIDVAMRDYVARRQAAMEAGEDPSDVPFFNDDQRRQLLLSAAEMSNLSTFRSRPIGARTGPVARRLFWLFGYPSFFFYKFFSLMNRVSSEPAWKGRAQNLPLALGVLLTAALVSSVGIGASEALKRLLLNKYSSVPTILELANASNKERLNTFLRGLAAALPYYGSIYNMMTDSAYRNGYDLNSSFFYLNVATDFLKTVKEMWQSHSIGLPALKFAERWTFPANYLARHVPQYAGLKEISAARNIISKGARESDMEQRLKKSINADIRYTPSSPILNEFMNAVGQGDMDGATNAFEKLVKYKMEVDNSDEAAARKSAVKSVQGRNPLTLLFATKPTDEEMAKIYARLPQDQANKARMMLENYANAVARVSGRTPQLTKPSMAPAGITTGPLMRGTSVSVPRLTDYLPSGGTSGGGYSGGVRRTSTRRRRSTSLRSRPSRRRRSRSLLRASTRRRSSLRRRTARVSTRVRRRRVRRRSSRIRLA